MLVWYGTRVWRAVCIRSFSDDWGAGMNIFDTDDVIYADRTDYWRDAISRTFVPLECAFAGSTKAGTIRTGSWGNLRISEINCSAQDVVRARKGADNHPDNLILLSFVSEGTTAVVQAGNHACLGQGEFGLYNTRFPYELHLNGESRQHVVQIPGEHLWQRLGKTDRFVASTFGKHHQLMPFLQMFLNNLMTLPDDIPQKYAAMLYDQFLELLTSIISDESKLRKGGAGTYHGLLFQIKIMINSHLAEHTLSAATVAESFSISSRYLSMLFQKDGTSFGKYLLNQRLTKSAEALRSSLHANTPISQIAWRYGFSDMSYFSREFRAKFGCSPTDYRHNSREADNPCGADA